MDPVERRLRDFYEVEASERLRPTQGARRNQTCEEFAASLATTGHATMIDVGSGPASDAEPFADHGVRSVGVDLAIGNATIGAERDHTVVPASVFSLPFASGMFSAGWSMSTLQHIPDERIDAAFAEFVRVLEPGAPVVLGIWGGRDEVIESEWASTGIQLPRHFTLRTHDRLREIIGRHLVIDRDETFASGPSDWEYHLSWAAAPSAR